MRKRHNMRLIGCLLVVIILLVACGGQATEAPPPPTEAPEEVEAAPEPTEAPPEEEAPAEVAELDWFMPSYGPNFDGFMEEIAAEFNAAHEGEAVVTLSYVDEETFKTKLLVDLRSDDPPDIFFQWEGGKAKHTVDNGYAAVLDDYYEEFGWNDILPSGVIALSEFDGHKYFVGWNMAGMPVYYNKTLFEENGVEVPTTWDEMMAAAEVFKAAGIAPFNLGNLNKWPPQFWHENILVHKYGIDVWNQLVNDEIPWTDERVVDSLQMLADLAAEGYFHPEMNAMDLSTAAIPWADGEAAMWLQGTWMPKYFEESEYETDFFLFPEMDPAIGQYPQVFCDFTTMIHANSPHKDQAAEFLDTLISAENQTKFMELGFGIATNVEADTSYLPDTTARFLKESTEIGRPGFMPIDHQFDPSISSEYLDALQAMLGGMMSAQEVAETTEAAAVEFRGPIE